MQTTHCASADELRAFTLGLLGDSQSTVIEQHIEQCTACEQTIAGFDDTADSMLDSLRTSAVADSGHSADGSQVMHEALSRLRAPWRTKPAGHVAPTCDWVRDYELQDTLGTGGMGTVYRAVHTRLARVVALKLLPARRLRDGVAVDRFEREMKAIGRLDHPAIVRATDAGEVDGTHFLAMDYVEGMDLSLLVRLVGPLSVPDACELIRQTAVGLQYAHDQGLIHRDVKPSNLMLDIRGSQVTGPSAGGAVRILDLGLALFGAASEAVDELTTVGQLMGTLDYMAPEQADNCHEVDVRADIYSLGATLFKLLCGKAPYESDENRTPLQKMKALATVDPDSLSDRDVRVSDELTAIVDRMLRRDPEERFAKAAEVAAALQPFCAGHDLNALIGRGMDEQRRQPAVEPALPRHAPEIPSSLLPRPAMEPSERLAGDAVPQVAAAGSDRSRGWRRWLMTTSAAALLLLFGGIIWIQTDTGRLKIECVDDNVPGGDSSGQ